MAVEKGLKQSALTESDKQQLRQFGEAIEFSDRENIVMCFEQYLGVLKEEISEINRVVRTKTRLYRSLGVLAGVFIVVLFI